MITANKQFDNFKKCISYKKRFDTWCGTISIGKMRFSHQSLKFATARVAKPAIAQQLYNEVVKYCNKNGIDLNKELALKIDNKRK